MVIIDSEKCIGCAACADDCIALNIEIKDGIAVLKKPCFQCGHCVAICPAGAVSIDDYDMNDVNEYIPENIITDPEKVLHSIKMRRSIRSYKKLPIEQEKLEYLLQAGRYTATAKNMQDCTFVFVQKELDYVKESVWGYIDEQTAQHGKNLPKDFLPFVAFSRRRKADPSDDFLFRNAPAVLYIASESVIDAGLAAQNIENMALSLGLGAMYNGFLAGITEKNKELKTWLGIEEKQIHACMLLGYPDRQYARTAPRKEADVRWR